MTPEVLAWFEKKGILAETVADFKVDTLPDGAVAFPYGGVGLKLRYGIPTGERSFRWAKGVDPVLFNRRDLAARHIFLVEGETDTMRLHQELSNVPDVGVVGLPGIETWNIGMADDLRPIERVYVILDNDLDYRVAGRVDAAWRQIRADLGSKAKRIVLPRGINDVCEFFEDYNLDSLRVLVERQPGPGESRFKTLDLTQEPPPIRWLVEGMICRGDIHLFIGEPGIGKSWLTMGLATAIAGAAGHYLGRNVVEQGRVLYFDEENPEDLVYDRFKKLGLTEAYAKNIRFINNVGVRLDKDPDSIVDEAVEYEPHLIVLDSLTRFHTEDENSAGSMSSLFNNGIKPLARATGAAVVVIHHANKGDALSSYKRSRGSGDITASVDAGFDIKQIDNQTLSVSAFKSRRLVQGDTLFVSLIDTDEGVELLGLAGYASGVF